MRKNIVAAALALAVVVLLPQVLPAQDFHQTYTMAAGSRVSIRNVSGEIKVTAYGGPAIVVDAYRVGRDRDLVKVEDKSTAGQVSIGVSYPENCNCDASVNFEVRVPANVDFVFDRLASVSGNVEVTGIRGDLRVESVSGTVTARDVTGLVKASSVSGNVDVEITRLDAAGELKFSSVSGNVSVKAPMTLSADIDMSTLSGGLQTDFPITVEKKEYGPGQYARGILGGGGSTLRISTVSGSVSLTRM